NCMQARLWISRRRLHIRHISTLLNIDPIIGRRPGDVPHVSRPAPPARADPDRPLGRVLPAAAERAGAPRPAHIGTEQPARAAAKKPWSRWNKALWRLRAPAPPRGRADRTGRGDGR